MSKLSKCANDLCDVYFIRKNGQLYHSTRCSLAQQRRKARAKKIKLYFVNCWNDICQIKIDTYTIRAVSSFEAERLISLRVDYDNYEAQEGEHVAK